MTILLNIPQDSVHSIDPSSVEQAASTTLEQQGIETESDLTILITDNDQIQQLNHDYRGIDAPTDVLAFPAGYTDPDTQRYYLGDVIISYQQAWDQAEKANHLLEDEIKLLVVHGVLHLLGHNHLEPEEKARMWSAQAKILTYLGANVALPE
jgi:probable rRNA maturation factor